MPFDTPYDATHPVSRDPRGDWRDATGFGGLLQRLTAYGNYAGFGNRNEKQGGYFPPLDGIDAAAQRHDAGYSRDAATGNPFLNWDTMHAVAPDDRRLVADIDAEMAENGGRYSPEAEAYSRAARGLFGARAMGVGAIDWADGKAGEAWDGVGSFIHSARDWHSLDDVGTGLADGGLRAGGWLGHTGAEAWDGVSHAASTIEDLGPRGALAAGIGFLDVGVAGTGHVLGKGWDAAKSGAGHVFDWLAD
jgi:hypothetical protein